MVKLSVGYFQGNNVQPVIPEYDYEEIAGNIAEIDDKIMKIKHAVNVTNATNLIQVGETQMTADVILIRMAQLNKRKAILDNMRKQQPKSRVNHGGFMARNNTPEYQYINYNLDLVKREYERIDAEIAMMQIALDKYNQTVEFEVLL